MKSNVPTPRAHGRPDAAFSEDAYQVAFEALAVRFSEEVARREEGELEQHRRHAVVDALRPLNDADAIHRAAFKLLNSFLPACQMGFASVAPGSPAFEFRLSCELDHVPGLTGTGGQIKAFGTAVDAALRDGVAVAIADVETDTRTARSRAMYAGLNMRACLLVPVTKDGTLRALLTLHQAHPCQWNVAYITLVQEVAERIWNALEHADATERQRVAEQALRAARRAEGEQLRSMFEQAPGFMAICRGSRHVFEFVNAAFIGVVGERSLLGLPVREALPELAGQGFFELLDDAYASGMPRCAHDVPMLVQPDAHTAARRLYVDFVYQPIRDASGVVTGIFVEGSDATERHVALELLETSRARLGEGMVAARMAIWDWDLASEEITFSQNTCDVFGTTWESISDVWNAICEEDLERLTLAGEAAEAVCGSYEEVVRIKRAGYDDPLWLQIHGKFIADEAGVARAVRSVAIDVTGLKYAQKALQDADARKDEFLAMLAHELRNPLAPIRAGAQLLSMVHGDGRQVKRMGAVIARQADHMTSLIDDMLDVSRVTSGLVTLESNRQEIWSIVGEAVEQIMPMMQERCHRLTIDNPGQPYWVLGDRKRLVQVLANLLQNAAKYTPAKGHIRVSAVVAQGEVALTVADDGMGMDAELVPHVFELFSQEKRASDRTQGGLGLGLALVARLVALHGGRVEAHSAGVGCGSAFTVILPTMDADGAALTLVAPEVMPERAPLRLMVVDDNVDAANILGIWLESFGHHVQIAYSPAAVLEQATSGCYDAYVLDIGLPGMDGNELARRLRQLPNNANAIMIANTGYGGEYDKAEASAAGFDHYFVKPVNLPRLEGVLAGITHRVAA